MSYENLAERKQEELIIYETYWSYSWTRILVTEKDDEVRIYKDYYGSCSACDSYEAEFWYSNCEYTKEKKENFAIDYEPFLVRRKDEITEQDIEDAILINKDYDMTDSEAKELIERLKELYIK